MSPTIFKLLESQRKLIFQSVQNKLAHNLQAINLSQAEGTGMDRLGYIV